MTTDLEHSKPKMIPRNHELSTAEVAKHVEKNRVKAQKGRRCVDGRYETELNQQGTIARPGGDLGYALALHGLSHEKGWNLTAQECVDIVFDALVNGIKDKFFMHSDKHTEEQSEKTKDDAKIGCGHVYQASISFNSDLYGVNSILVKEMISYSRKLATNENNKVVNVVLPGNHRETGVLKVIGKRHTVNSYDEETGLMFFVYDQARDDEFMQKLVAVVNKRRLNKKIGGLNYQELKRVSDKQLAATLSILASGKPVFEIDADNKLYLVKYVRTVQ